MKLPTFLCLALCSHSLGAEPEKLSPLDAQLLLEKLKVLREGSNERIAVRYKTAHSAFRAAIQSDSAAHDFYLKCIEKVQFEDEKKKTSEFRDWKRRHKERTDTPAFRRALRHQLNWLVLTLQAASEPEKRDELWVKALDQIDRIIDDAEDLEGEQSRLRRSVLGTVFASAYGLEGVKVEDWPGAPLQIDSVYEQLILPPLRSPKKLADLRKAWEKRILHEGEILQWGRETGARGELSADMERFLTERRPQMQWDMEMDLFAAGDQKGAALRMLEHIEKHPSHENCPDWISAFQVAIKGEITPPVSGGNEAAGEPGE